MIHRGEALLEELRRYAPLDVEDAEHCARLIDLVERSDDPFSRHTFLPGHVTASCFIVDGRAQLLLHHHRRLDRWLQMGGHVEDGESAADAALREGAEESGLRDLELMVHGIADVDVHEIPAGKGEPAHLHFDVRYVARTLDAGGIVIDRNESQALRWVDLATATDLMRTPESIRVVRKIEAVPWRS